MEGLTTHIKDGMKKNGMQKNGMQKSGMQKNGMKVGKKGREYCKHVVTYIYFVNSALSLINIFHSIHKQY